MPDDIIISELSNAATIDDSAVFPLTQDNGGSPATFKASMSEIAGKVAEGTIFANLETTAKQIIPAINEAAQSGGGTSDIISTASGAIATFSDGGDNIPLKSCDVAIVAQQASGTPSPTNPLSISGFSSVDTVVVNKNLWGNGDISATTNTGVTLLKQFTGQYTISGVWATNSGYSCLAIFYSGATEITRNIFATGSRTSFTYNFTSPLTRVVFYAGDNYNHSNGKTFTITDIQFEEGESATSYEAPTVHTVNLGQTIYGATADLVNGNGTKTWGYVEFDGSEDETWSMHPTISNLFYIDNALPNAYYNQDEADFAISNIYEQNAYSPLSSLPNNKFAIGYPNILRLAVKNTACADLTSFKTALSSTPMQVVYKLTTPTAFTFTGANIPTLSGENNIYSNCGDVEVEYFNENADQTSELIDAKQEFCNYSTEEKVVGKWLDGSPLYEKTLLFNNVKLDKSDSTSELVHGISNIGSVRFVSEVYFDFSGGVNGWSPANNGLWNNGVYNFYWCVGETSIFILSANGVYFDANPNRSYLVKIRYTKA
jgi:hypothetical protein